MGEDLLDDRPIEDGNNDLELAAGYGTLGWTHSCGSGKSIARIASGLQPEVDFAFVGGQPRAIRSRLAALQVSS